MNRPQGTKSVLHPKISTRKGFTILEVIVVMFILWLLSALLYPVLVKAQDESLKVVCQENLHSIGIGLTLYTADYDDLYPVAINKTDSLNPEFIPSTHPPVNQIPWMRDVLQPYLRGNDNVFRCPKDTEGFNTGNERLPRNQFFPSVYSLELSSYRFILKSYWHRSFSSLTPETLIAGDGGNFHARDLDPMDFNSPSANWLHADGHVKFE
jgi:prepilin-type N-terminal cleavage/methylation domain-containing protein/prepilin-type processing-associated H-X9-DG protein